MQNSSPEKKEMTAKYNNRDTSSQFCRLHDRDDSNDRNNYDPNRSRML